MHPRLTNAKVRRDCLSFRVTFQEVSLVLISIVETLDREKS